MQASLVVFYILLSSSYAADKDIYAQLGCIKDGIATTEEIMLDPVLRIKSPDGLNMKKMYLTSFTIYSSRDINNPISNRSSDGRLNDEQLALIQRSRPGETIWIEDTKVTLVNEMMCSRRLAPLKIKVY
ncbi:MAG: GldM family protein [Flavobacteriales bacterium]